MDEVHPVEIEECFRIFSGPSNNRLSTDSIGPALRSLGVYITEAALTTLQSDIGESHALDLNEFKELYDKLQNTSERDTEGSLREAFQVFDVSGTGQISIKDLRHILTTLGERLSDSDMDAFLLGAGVPLDTDVNIDYEQFSHMLRNVQNDPI
ncbi:hypothetical protein FOL47_007492 [Perkinsus chesapeaki]|uniref:Calmodulin n=1 Tax=Perkinsus chesapeaki TaxID=330153 RepID=A0A7J6LK20_PERCH|nr:hypothetical protein FOL47_007492 [Perkinsus chesapeaki]